MEITSKKNCIIITGGPGMGITTLIEELLLQGYDCIPERGREIIQQQVKSKENALPWKDKNAFALLMFSRSLQDFNRIKKENGVVFFNRGIPDILGYLELCDLAVPKEMLDAARNLRYHTNVFITPPWKQIYLNDPERKQSFEEAVHSYDKMVKIYQEFGYKLIEVPPLPISDRIHFIGSFL